MKIRLIDWVSGFFKSKDDKEVVRINPSTYRDDASTRLEVDMYALFTVISFISGVIAKCEVKTFWRNKEIRSADWVSLNYKPNENQNATEFWEEIINRMLYYGDAVVFQVGSQRIIADSYNKEDFAVKQNRYSDLTRDGCNFNKRYPESDILHFTYKGAGAHNILHELMVTYSELIEGAAEKYYQGTGEKGILSVDSVARGNQKDFEETFAALKSNYFKAYFKERNAVLPLFHGYEYKPTTAQGQYTNEISDIKTLTDEALTRMAQAYRVPPAVIKGDTANSDVETYRMFTTHCVEPIARLISQELTRKLFTVDEIIAGARIEIDTKHIRHFDLFDSANALDKLVANTMLSTDEGRAEIGLEPLNTWWSGLHIMTKNYTSAEIAMRGEENGNGNEEYKALGDEEQSGES